MEIGLILVVALIVIGPQKLPQLAGQIARTIRDLQRTATDFSREITTPVNDLKRDIARPVHQLHRELETELQNDPYKHLADGDSETATGDDHPPHSEMASTADAEDTHVSDAAQHDESDDLGSYASVEEEERIFQVEEANAEPDTGAEMLSRVGLDQPTEPTALPTVRAPQGAIAHAHPDDMRGPVPPESISEPDVAVDGATPPTTGKTVET